MLCCESFTVWYPHKLQFALKTASLLLTKDLKLMTIKGSDSTVLAMSSVHHQQALVPNSPERPGHQ